jgi:hypothetical protein
MKNFLITIFFLGVAAAGCGREPSTSPVPQWHSWDQVVLTETHASAGEPGSEVTVRSDGALTLVIGRGNSVSSRGLLAGDRLETLTRLVDALPPSSYAAPEPCTADGFVMTVAAGGAVRTFASGSCDLAAPEAVRRLHESLAGLVASTQAPRAVVVPFQVLLSGTSSALHRPVRAVLQDRDALAQFLREHAPDQPTAVPRVDFARQFVVAEWLGDRPTTEYTLELAGAEITQTLDGTEWFRLRFHRFTPGPTCPTADQVTQPFVLVALNRHPEELLFEDTTEEVACE